MKLEMSLGLCVTVVWVQSIYMAVMEPCMALHHCAVLLYIECGTEQHPICDEKRRLEPNLSKRLKLLLTSLQQFS